MASANCFNLDKSKNLSSGNELNPNTTNQPTKYKAFADDNLSMASMMEPGSVFTNHSQEHSLSSSQFCIFECNTTSDWLNRMV